MAVMRFEKFEYDKFRTRVFEKLKNVSRCRSKMVKFLGVWYFKRMDDKEFETKKDIIVQRLDGIRTYQELSDWMCREQVIRDPMDNV
jgi:hypothetical protein